MKKAEPAPAGRGGKFDDRARPGPRRARCGDRPRRPRRPARAAIGDDRREDRGPRLGDAAFRAQRDALEHAQAALKKLAAQAHGEALTQLMTAWEQRSADQVPSQQELGKVGDAGGARSSWAQALASRAGRRCRRGAAAAGDRGRNADAGRADHARAGSCNCSC